MKKRHALLVVFALGTALASTSVAESVTPLYDLSGIWSNGSDPGSTHIFQNGSEVKSVYVNKGFVQSFSGKFVNPNSVEGTWLRKNRSNGCVTKLKETTSVNSANSYSVEWIALDSNCDLAKGRGGKGNLTRQKAIEDSLWY
jgi:hypothetical protein